MLKLLMMVAMVIIGLLGYKVYNSSYNNIDVEASKTMTKVEMETSINPSERDGKEVVDDIDNVLNMNATQSSNKVKQVTDKVMEIGEDLQDRSYEEIDHDISLSFEEKAIMIEKKLDYEISHMQISSEEITRIEINKIINNKGKIK